MSYLGFVHGTLSALRRMRPAGHGAIVQVGSALAYRGIPLQSAYCGSKHANPACSTHYLARTGFSGQQTDRPHDPTDPGNLRRPRDAAPGTDEGAHGDFDDRSHPRSLQVWASQHHGAVAAGLAAGAAAVSAIARRR